MDRAGNAIKLWPYVAVVQKLQDYEICLLDLFFFSLNASRWTKGTSSYPQPGYTLVRGNATTLEAEPRSFAKSLISEMCITANCLYRP